MATLESLVNLTAFALGAIALLFSTKAAVAYHNNDEGFDRKAKFAAIVALVAIVSLLMRLLFVVEEISRSLN